MADFSWLRLSEKCSSFPNQWWRMTGFFFLFFFLLRYSVAVARNVTSERCKLIFVPNSPCVSHHSACRLCLQSIRNMLHDPLWQVTAALGVNTVVCEQSEDARCGSRLWYYIMIKYKSLKFVNLTVDSIFAVKSCCLQWCKITAFVLATTIPSSKMVHATFATFCITSWRGRSDPLLSTSHHKFKQPRISHQEFTLSKYQAPRGIYGEECWSWKCAC